MVGPLGSLQPLQRILRTALEAHLEVEPGALDARGADRAQDVPLRHLLAQLHARLGEVGVEGVVLAAVVEDDHQAVALEAVGEDHRPFVHGPGGGVGGGVDLDPVLDRVGVELRMLVAAESRTDAARTRPGQAAAEGGHRHGGVALLHPLQERPELSLRLLELLDVGGVGLLLLDDRREQLRLALPLLVEVAPGAFELRAQGDRFQSPARQLLLLRAKGLEVGPEGRDERVVPAGNRGHEAVAAEEVRRVIHGEQKAQVAQLAQLVEGAGVGDEEGTGRVAALRQLPDPLQDHVHLGLGALQAELDLAQLLPAQAHLHLEALDVAEQALLLAAQAGQLTSEGLAALPYIAQPVLAGWDGGGRGGDLSRGRSRRGRGRRVTALGREERQDEGQGLHVRESGESRRILT